jgi:hypothetical protein
LVPVKSLAAGDCAADDVIERARANLHVRIGHTRARIDVTPAPEPDAPDRPGTAPRPQCRRDAELARLYDDGTINQATRQQLQHTCHRAGSSTCSATRSASRSAGTCSGTGT